MTSPSLLREEMTFIRKRRTMPHLHYETSIAGHHGDVSKCFIAAQMLMPLAALHLERRVISTHRVDVVPLAEMQDERMQKSEDIGWKKLGELNRN